jgi:uncharacterized protein (UPF0548 family)
MRILSKRKGLEAPFSCDEWSHLATNSSREEAAQGFLHDTYESTFDGDFARAVDALLEYRIFAPSRMYAQVCTPDRRVAVGATIVQRVIWGPISIETAVRVIEVDRSPDHASFTYATLRGHPERGVASFAVTRVGAGGRFEAQAWSRAGHWLTTIGKPVSRYLQRTITREAVVSFCALASRGRGLTSG